jgi:histidine triad (HIT) family protein
MTDCVFCKIITEEIPSKKVFENENLIAFNDINPKAKVHVLVVPKKHIDSVINLDDQNLAGELIVVAKEIAKNNSLQGYKLVVNVGKDGGQVVEHLHLHLLSGDANMNSI